MDASVIIINWNTKELLINCLNSVYGTVKTLAFEVWVVDNGSTDGSVEAIKTVFPDVRLIENKKNLGFAQANNQALRQMNGRYAVLLNSDAILTNGAVETIIRFMDKNNNISICGGQLLNADDSKQNSIANIPTLATELLNKSLLRRLFPKKYPGKEHYFKEPIGVDSIVGACMVVRKEAIDDVGLLDESYFFFLEETDWCLNMRKRGWKVFYHPDAKIYHLQGQSAAKVNMKARIEYWRSRYIFFKKNYGTTFLNILKAGLFLRLILNFLLMSVVAIATFYRKEKIKNKLLLYKRLIHWHLKGCPSDWGLKGV